MSGTGELRQLKQLEDEGNLSLVLSEVERLEKRFTELGWHQQLADALLAKIRALLRLGRLEENQKVIIQCEHVLTFLEEPKEVKKRKGHLLRNKGAIHSLKNEMEKALECYQQSLALAEEVDDKEGMKMVLNNIATHYWELGDLKLALNYAQQVKTLSEEIGNKSLIANSLYFLGFLYYSKSDMEQAQDYYQQALTIGKEYNYITVMAGVYHGLGDINWELGNLEQASTYFEQSVLLNEKSGSKQELVFDLFCWLGLTIEMNSLAQAQHLLQRLQQIHEQDESSFVQPWYRLGQAMFLKTSSRITDKAKAQNILVELVKEEFPSVALKIMALLNLCILLLDEFKINEDQAVFQEALTFTQQVYSLTQKTQSHSFTIKLLLLQAKFATVEGDLTTAMDLLEQAKTIATDKGLVSLAARADTEKQQLEAQYDKWQKLIQSNAPIRAMFEQAKLEEYVKKAKRIIDLHH